ncbi:RNase H domain-containing protein [Trichonephila clavipes]|nr:RNase H domain-containing protein [Trichonephila clavipes]
MTDNENADKLVKLVRNINNDNFVSVTLLDANAIASFKLRGKSIPVQHPICNISGDCFKTKTIAGLRIRYYRGMNIDRDGKRIYRNCIITVFNTKLTPAHIFDRPAILAALQEIRVLLSSRNLYVGKIQQIARTVIWALGTVWFSPVMNTTSSSKIKYYSKISQVTKLSTS